MPPKTSGDQQVLFPLSLIRPHGTTSDLNKLALGLWRVDLHSRGRVGAASGLGHHSAGLGGGVLPHSWLLSFSSIQNTRQLLGVGRQMATLAARAALVRCVCVGDVTHSRAGRRLSGYLSVGGGELRGGRPSWSRSARARCFLPPSSQNLCECVEVFFFFLLLLWTVFRRGYVSRSLLGPPLHLIYTLLLNLVFCLR